MQVSDVRCKEHNPIDTNGPIHSIEDVQQELARALQAVADWEVYLTHPVDGSFHNGKRDFFETKEAVVRFLLF